MRDIGAKFRYSQVFLGIGSNLGNRLKHLQTAIDRIDSRPNISVKSRSEIYETEPLYYEDQSRFLNCVVELTTDLSPEGLMNCCLSIEKGMGRQRTEKRYGSRSIDIDILFFGSQIIHSRLIKIPHPRYAERKFVLIPMNDIAPDFICPLRQKPMKEMLMMCPDGSEVVSYLE